MSLTNSQAVLQSFRSGRLPFHLTVRYAVALVLTLMLITTFVGFARPTFPQGLVAKDQQLATEWWRAGQDIESYQPPKVPMDHKKGDSLPTFVPQEPVQISFELKPADEAAYVDIFIKRRGRNVGPPKRVPNESDASYEKRTQKFYSSVFKKMSEMDAMRLNNFTGSPEGAPTGNQIVLVSATNFKDRIGANEEEMLKVQTNRNMFCQRHGYTHHFVNMSDYEQTQTEDYAVLWLKYPIIRDTFAKFPEAQWIWWLDIDAIITNLDFDIGSRLLSPGAIRSLYTYDRPLNDGHGKYQGDLLLSESDFDPHNVKLIMTQDLYFGLNGGSFFVKRSEMTDTFFDMLYDPLIWNVENNFGEFKTFLEQAAINWAVRHHPSIKKQVAVFPQRAFNAYPFNVLSTKFDYGATGNSWIHAPGDLICHFAGCWKRNGWDCDFLWDGFFQMLGGRDWPTMIAEYREQERAEAVKKLVHSELLPQKTGTARAAVLVATATKVAVDVAASSQAPPVQAPPPPGTPAQAPPGPPPPGSPGPPGPPAQAPPAPGPPDLAPQSHVPQTAPAPAQVPPAQATPA